MNFLYAEKFENDRGAFLFLFLLLSFVCMKLFPSLLFIWMIEFVRTYIDTSSLMNSLDMHRHIGTYEEY